MSREDDDAFVGVDVLGVGVTECRELGDFQRIKDASLPARIATKVRLPVEHFFSVNLQSFCK